ncbi:MAG: rtcB [Phycisphaerales bacterium]|nr:rtcB [Phycisphaerales bacterium]
MSPKQLLRLGYPQGLAIGVASDLARRWRAELPAEQIEDELRAVLADPAAHLDHPHFADVARRLHAVAVPAFAERPEPAPYRVWGEGLEAGALDQMKQSARLPVAVRGALMPDAHLGYGLPIGGVLATENAVVPYAVGVDIACRMKLSVFDVPADQLNRLNDRLVNALRRETLFGTGGHFKKPHDHPVLDADWGVTPVTKRLFEKAREQLGTSGSGNHFAEFGTLTLDHPDLGLPAGSYLALLTHSGSRGAGAQVADFYSRLAMDRHPELPPELRRLAWLDMDTEAGQEYWAAMNLMGEYARANHAVIHKKVTKAMGFDVLAGVENHHNFSWLERHDGRDLYVHRKGATPAGKGVLGVIPGSMASPGFVVRGRGEAASLDSASHGAGRVMSRTAARQKFRWNHIKPLLEERGVQLLSAGIDENPHVYKDIHQVMAAQADLVEVVGRFDPRIVRMADAGEKPED